MAPRSNWQSTYQNIGQRHAGSALRHPKIFTRTGSSAPVRKFSFSVIPRVIWLGLAAVIFVGSLGWFLFFSRTFAIDDVQIVGSVNDNVRSDIEALRGQNLLRYTAGDMTNRLRGAQSSIRDLSISKGIPSTLRIEIALRDPAMLWQSGEHLYLIDPNGIVFQSDDILNVSRGKVPTVLDARQQPVIVGTRLVRTEFLSFVQELYERFPQRFPLTITQIEIGETTLNLTAITSAGWRVQFDTTRPVDTQLDALAKVIERYHEEIREYIDLRVPGRAYIK